MKIKLSPVRLKQLIREEIDRMLMVEELTIADIVKKESQNITDLIIRNQKPFSYILYNQLDITIVPKLTAVDKEVSVTCGCFNETKLEIEITVPVYNGQVLKPAVEACVYHELENAYQYYSTIGKNAVNPYYNVYDKAIKILESSVAPQQRDSDTYELALFVYCCYYKEQDAFVNDLYSRLVKTKDSINREWQNDSIIKNSQAYRALANIRNTVRNLKITYHHSDYSNEVNSYGKSKNWFIHLGENAEKRLSNKIKKAIIKAINDKAKNNGNMFETIL
jgi:hypothetical protein